MLSRLLSFSACNTKSSVIFLFLTLSIDFLFAAVTNYKKPSSLKQYKFTSFQFWRSEIWNGLMSYILFWKPWRKIFICLFILLFSKNLSHFLLLVPSSAFNISNTGPCPSHTAISGPLFCLPLPLLRTLVITSGPLKSTQITSLSSS